MSVKQIKSGAHKGKWRARVTWTDPRTGRRFDVRRIRRTRKEAQLAEADLVRGAELATAPQIQATTLRAYATSWLERRWDSGVIRKTSTLRGYESILRIHVLPTLGDLRVSQLTPRDVSGYVADKGRELSAGTVRNHLRLLRTIAADSVAEEYAERDWTARIPLPRPAGYTVDDPNLFTADQLGAALRVVSDYWRPLTLTLAFTGLRWCEVSALQWRDLRGFELWVVRSQVKGVVSTTKNEESARVTSVHPELLGVLEAHRARMVERQHPGLAAGWMFPTRTGGLHRGSPLRKPLQRALAEIGLEHRVTPHGLRRTFNNLARQVTDGTVVRALMGHVTEAMTDHYSHVQRHERARAVDNVVRLIRKASEP